MRQGVGVTASLVCLSSGEGDAVRGPVQKPPEVKGYRSPFLAKGNLMPHHVPRQQIPRPRQKWIAEGLQL